MSDGEIVGCVFSVITAVCLYGIIGALIGMAIDVMDNKVLFSCIFLWPIILPIYLIVCLVKTIKKIWG